MAANRDVGIIDPEATVQKTTKLSMAALLGSDKLREAISEMYQTLFLAAMQDPTSAPGETDEERTEYAKGQARRELHRGLGLIARRVTGEA
jgi:hypothetical protein